MKLLIFDTAVDGHHLEYIHHLYIGASENNIETKFLLPQKFEKIKDKFEWSKNDSISFTYITDEELTKCNKKNYFIASWNKCKILHKYIKQFDITHVFLITLAHFLPFLPFFIPKNTIVSGIIYRIYLYEWKYLSIFKRIKDIFEYLSIVYSNKISTAFILNDNASTIYLNKLYQTQKFVFLVDPIVPLNYVPKNIRNELNINNQKEVFLHFGAMYRRKGTLLILDSIKEIDSGMLQNMTFIFAGIINNDIKDEFQKKVNELNKNVQIIIFDEFCSYEQIYNLCFSSNCLLIPYYNTSFSSGVIGYAALFNKIAIGPAKGVLGKIIRKNKLGTSINNQTPESLAKAIINIKKIKTNNNIYIESNSVMNFNKTIFKNKSLK